MNVKYFFKKSITINAQILLKPKKSCAVCGPHAVLRESIWRWFYRFRSANFDVKDVLRSNPSTTKQFSILLWKLSETDTVTRYHDARELNISDQTALSHLEKAGYNWESDVWDLRHRNLFDRIPICDARQKRNEMEPFSKAVDHEWSKVDCKRQ